MERDDQSPSIIATLGCKGITPPHTHHPSNKSVADTLQLKCAKRDTKSRYRFARTNCQASELGPQTAPTMRQVGRQSQRLSRPTDTRPVVDHSVSSCVTVANTAFNETIEWMQKSSVADMQAMTHVVPGRYLWTHTVCATPSRTSRPPATMAQRNKSCGATLVVTQRHPTTCKNTFTLSTRDS